MTDKETVILIPDGKRGYLKVSEKEKETAERALQDLRPRYFEIYCKRNYENKNNKEISVEYKVTSSQISNLYRKGIEIVKKEIDVLRKQENLDSDIAVLRLSVRAYNALIDNSINFVKDLLSEDITFEELMTFRNLGRLSIEEIKNKTINFIKRNNLEDKVKIDLQNFLYKITIKKAHCPLCGNCVGEYVAD